MTDKASNDSIATGRPDAALRVISSMATRHLLAALIGEFEAASAARVVLESVGGVDAAKRVRAGESFDVVVLASDVIDALAASGHLVAGSRADIAASPIAVAVRAGAVRPDLSSADAVRRAVTAARRVGYSTGPSGTHLAKIFSGWDAGLQERSVVAPPGVPVATLVARGDVELGFQQLSELLGVDGIDVVGLLPVELQAITIFSGGVASASSDAPAARSLLAFLASPARAEARRRHGMDTP